MATLETRASAPIYVLTLSEHEAAVLYDVLAFVHESPDMNALFETLRAGGVPDRSFGFKGSLALSRTRGAKPEAGGTA